MYGSIIAIVSVVADVVGVAGVPADVRWVGANATSELPQFRADQVASTQ